MTAYKSSTVSLQIGNGGSPSEVFTELGGLQIIRMNVSSRIVNASNLSSGAWRKLISPSGSQAGINSLSISGNGLFTAQTSEETLRQKAFSGASCNYKLVFANLSSITGEFKISEYSRNASVDGQEGYSISLESAGDITYTAP
jgi:TP901-1 family phage major tail protein